MSNETTEQTEVTKISLEKAQLLDAIKKVLPGVEKGNTTIDGADQILFTGTTVSSYNEIIAVTAPCDTKGMSFSVKGMDFYNLVAHLNDIMITIERVENKLKIKGGRNKTTMALLDPTNISASVSSLDVDSLEYKPLPAEFLDSARICTLSSNTDTTKGIAVGVYNGKTSVFGIDQNRICVAQIPESMDSFWVDDGVFNDALKVGTPKEYCVNNVWFHLHYEDGTIFSAHTRDIVAYPFENCAGILDEIPKSTPIVSGRLPSTLAEAVSRVAILASGMDAKNSKLVEMTFRKDELELHAEKLGGEASETIPWETPLEVDPNEAQVWVDTAFLLEASNKAMDFSLSMVGGAPALIFKSGNYMQLVSATTK